MVPQSGGAKEGKAAAHGKLKGTRSRPRGVGLADNKQTVGEGRVGEEVEAAVQTSEGHGSLEVERGETQFQMKAGDGRKGDTEGSSQGFVQKKL